jgi:adenylate cyclase
MILGTAHVWANEHDAAITETQRAYRLNPNDAYVCLALGNKLDLAGCSKDGIDQLERALELNPQDPRVHMYMCFLVRAYINAGRYEDALTRARLAAQRRADYAQAHYMTAVALGHLGRSEEARAALDACERVQAGFVAKRAEWQPYPDPSANDHIRAGLSKAGLVE